MTGRGSRGEADSPTRGDGQGNGRPGRLPSAREAAGPPPARGPLPSPPPASLRPASAPAVQTPPPARQAGELQIVEVEFKGLRTDYFTFRHILPLRRLEYVVVQADRGQDLGVVKRLADAASHTCGGGCEEAGERPVAPPSKRVLRRASPAEVERLLELRAQEMEVRRRTRELVGKHGLKMKVSEAEWQWDRNKLIVYFTAEKRVDFRALVRDMARTFRTRIELRQIGVRDEARRVGGLGRCGRELCCRAWLDQIEPVTLQLAKEQGLSLNPGQISGACGRLMNCLHYERALYQRARKRFPPVGRRLRTSRGEEEVLSWNIFRETVSLRDGQGEIRTVLLDELRTESERARGGEAHPGAS
ncbi:MAG: stage 0 sporulation family protein [Gemmatimonadota bacterium]